MSKWINKNLFDDFRKEKVEEKDNTGGGFRRSDLLWETPEKGTVEQAKVYEGRFLQHPDCKPYDKYYYHMWQSGDNWIFILCLKTHGMKEYCPFCSANVKLYQGTEQDKKQAYLIKRKERYVGNFYVSKDPRDTDREDENKVVGTVRLYEFPLAVEKKLKKEIVDQDEGYGPEIFDPSEDGRNFIIRVLSTKKDDAGKQWPDYSSSDFSRSQSSLGDDAEIENIMKQCTNIKDYISSMEISKDKMVEILKNEFLWELVEDECIKNGFFEVTESEEKPEEEKKEEKPEEEKKEEKPEEEKKEEKPEEKDDLDLDDDELLAELDNM